MVDLAVAGAPMASTDVHLAGHDVLGSMTLDARLGNTPKRYVGPAPHINMRTPDQVLKSVVFLGILDTGLGRNEIKRIGTGFIVCYTLDGESGYRYLVTARHVAEKLTAVDARVQYNTEHGLQTATLSNKWWYHETERGAVDAAVCPFELNADVVPVPTTMFLSDEDIEDFYVGPGDEVTIAGLFSPIPGKERIIPIVRRGTVAMLPRDLIPIAAVQGNSPEIVGYLTEVRSVGGISGSPAFVRAPIGIDYRVITRSHRARIAKAHLQGDYFLLGLCHGHWEIPPSTMNSPTIHKPNQGDPSINLGIAIVVPAKKILEVLEHPDLVAMRREANKATKTDASGTIVLD